MGRAGEEQFWREGMGRISLGHVESEMSVTGAGRCPWGPNVDRQNLELSVHAWDLFKARGCYERSPRE